MIAQSSLVVRKLLLIEQVTDLAFDGNKTSRISDSSHMLLESRHNNNAVTQRLVYGIPQLWVGLQDGGAQIEPFLQKLDAGLDGRHLGEKMGNFDSDVTELGLEVVEYFDGLCGAGHQR